MRPGTVTVWRWCKEHWTRDPDPIVIFQLIDEFRDGRIKVPDDVLQHISGSRRPANDPGYVYVIEEEPVGYRLIWVQH
jgi:hypothetical protein